MYACYLDDSYTDASGVVTLAGYFAPIDTWAAYETAAAAVYADFGVSCLHATDLRGTRGEFKGWPRERKNEFIAALYALLPQDEVCGVSVAVMRSLAKGFNKAHRKTASHSPLGMAFGILASTVSEGRRLPVPTKKRPMSFYVETGNNNNKDIRRVFDIARRADPNTPATSLEFLRKDQSKALHLADFYALQSRRIANTFARAHFRVEAAFGAVEPEFAKAAARLPHSLDVLHGGVSQLIGEPNQLIAGSREQICFGPDIRALRAEG